MATLWDAVLFALLSFCMQLLLQFLRGGGSVRVRLVPSPLSKARSAGTV